MSKKKKDPLQKVLREAELYAELLCRTTIRPLPNLNKPLRQLLRMNTNLTREEFDIVVNVLAKA